MSDKNPNTGNANSIKPSSWMLLRPHIPAKLHHLLDLSISAEETAAEITERSDGEGISRLQDFIFRIFDEYLKMVKDSLTEDGFKDVTNDISKAFGNFIDTEGRPKDVSDTLADKKLNNTLDIFLPNFIAPVMSFLHSRIYDSFIETIAKGNETFPMMFSSTSLEKVMDEAGTEELVVKPNDWRNIKATLPAKFGHLVDLGADMEELQRHMKRMGEEYTTDVNIGRFRDLSIDIMREYENLNKGHASDIAPIREGIGKALGVYCDRNGRMRTVDEIFKETLEKQGFFPDCIVPIMAYIHSMIFVPLLEAREKVREKFTSWFISTASRKGGVYPKGEEKQLLTMPKKEEGEETEEAPPEEKK